jgi:DNA-binding NarL/FixJ family response regulator
VELLQEAVATFEDGLLRCEAARASYDLGEALLATGEREAARKAFAAALATGERVGAQRIEQRARDALVGLGARPRRRTTSGVQALTSGERRVAELAAQGMPNREIAERLFLTPKTVETHLTSTYRKLGISSRAQLADRLH